MLALFLLASFASAELTITDENVVFEADYSELNDDDCDDSTDDCEDYITETITFKVSNSEAVAIEAEISVDITGTGYSDDGAKDVTIEANAVDQELTYEVRVPHEKDSGESNIGTITVTDKADAANTASKDLVQNTLTMLRFIELEVDYTSEDGSESEDFDGDDEADTEWDLAERAIPGEEIIFTFKYENSLDKDYQDSDFDEVIITIDGDDLSDEVDDEWDLGSLDAEADDTFEIAFIPEDDADGNYELEITFEAEDENNVKYEVVRTLSIEIKRERDDVRIVTSEALGTVDSCSEELLFKVKIRNFGSDNQKYAGVTIYNEALDINENIQDLELDEFDDSDDSWEKTFNFALDNIEADTYLFDIRSYIDRDEEMDHELVNVVVSECATEDTTSDDETDSEEETQQEEDSLDTTGTPSEDNDQDVESDSTQVGSSEVVETVENPYTTEDFFIATIIVAFVLIVAMIVIFIVVLLK